MKQGVATPGLEDGEAEESGTFKGLLRDPTFYLGLFFLVMILGQGAFYAVAFQLPSDALPVEGEVSEAGHGNDASP